jgi:hypothetical protein
MVHRSDDDRVRIALHGVVATAGITGAGVVAVGIISLGRCGFLRDAAQPGTLSESLCREGTGWVMFLIVALAPAVAGLGGTVRAAASRNRRLLRLPLAVAATVPAGVALLYLVSGWL